MVATTGATAVICVCDQSATWERISQAFGNQPGFLLIRSGPDLKDLGVLSHRLGTAVLLVESSFFEVHSASAIREFLAEGNTEILAMVHAEENEEALIQRGCMGVVAGQPSLEIYRKAVRAIKAGEIWASRKALSRLLREKLVKVRPSVLTHRQDEILKLISIGLSNQEVAERLFISRETVRWHVRSLYSRLGVSDRQGARHYALQLKSDVGK